MQLKGTLPVLVLQILAAGPRHGYQIAQQIKLQSQGLLDFKEGSLYPALHTHENQGNVASYERTLNGRIRRYYKLTPKGAKLLEEGKKSWRELAAAVNGILEGA